MAEATVAVEAPVEAVPEKRQSGASTLTRMVRYSAIRVVSLFVTVVIGVYLTILIANMGGHVDKIQRGQIEETVSMALATNPAYKALSEAEKQNQRALLIAIQVKRLGLDKPFITRSFILLKDALTLNLGRAQQMTSDTGSKEVKNIILERLPPTLLLVGTGDLILFFGGLLIGLSLSRKYGGWLDKLFVVMAPTSSAPAWFYGIFLILIFAALLGWLPFGGMTDAPPPENPLAYALSVAKHMLLPLTAWTLSSIFLNSFAQRTFFLIYSSEDYVDMAKAKGLTSKDIERRYILRPTLPTIITNFALLMIAMWTGAIIFETVFQWPGLGRQLYRAIQAYETAVVVGEAVVYAYLLALTIFLLDFIYALVDPRVRIGGGAGRAG
jgi:peptide/nickel transport system permease protein